eukprot:scaffold87784_cov19-Tisochrysis_lutea.AAC.2
MLCAQGAKGGKTGAGPSTRGGTEGGGGDGKVLGMFKQVRFQASRECCWAAWGGGKRLKSSGLKGKFVEPVELAHFVLRAGA